MSSIKPNDVVVTDGIKHHFRFPSIGEIVPIIVTGNEYISKKTEYWMRNQCETQNMN